jgi:hypothetical protein
VTERKFESYRRTGRRLALPFEKILDSYWTKARQLRAMVAEFDRLEVPEDADVRLMWRSDDHEIGPSGWSLNIIVPGTDHD